MLRPEREKEIRSFKCVGEYGSIIPELLAEIDRLRSKSDDNNKQAGIFSDMIDQALYELLNGIRERDMLKQQLDLAVEELKFYGDRQTYEETHVDDIPNRANIALAKIEGTK